MRKILVLRPEVNKREFKKVYQKYFFGKIKKIEFDKASHLLRKFSRKNFFRKIEKFPKKKERFADENLDFEKNETFD